MQPSRNESCPCGSGVRFKNCCGRLPQNAAPASRPIPYADVLPIDTCGYRDMADAYERSMVDLLRRGNLPQAEFLVRNNLLQQGVNAKALNCLGWIAAAVGLSETATEFFAQAAEMAPVWTEARSNLTQMHRLAGAAKHSTGADQPTRFLLIKAWGFGFWSDVSHIVSQLLIAELTGRIPIVHWGANSLFWDGTLPNAFEAYFEPVSAATTDNLRNEELTIWPPKWTHRNLLDGEIHKWTGPYSRLAGLYMLSREERVVVGDFFSSVFELRPWIPKHSRLYSMTVDDLHSYLVRKYLRPKPDVLEAVARIYETHIAAGEFIAVHARGSDKILEMPDLDAVNQEYRRAIEEFRTRHATRKIFLMTDDSRLRDSYVSHYGNDVFCTDCQRTDTAQGVHYQAGRNRRQLGYEVMVDAYLAIRAKAFIGNGYSNPSLLVRYLKTWPTDHVKLIGPNMYHLHNPVLHRW
jgi:protein O-GlcNAc transferase